MCFKVTPKPASAAALLNGMHLRALAPAEQLPRCVRFNVLDRGLPCTAELDPDNGPAQAQAAGAQAALAAWGIDGRRASQYSAFCTCHEAAKIC